MAIAYHVIISAYGFWLPNDPRESYSDFVGSWDLYRFGKATTVATHRSMAHVTHDRGLRDGGEGVVEIPEVHFDGVQANGIANGFAGCARVYGMRVYGCAILPEHVHLVMTLGKLGTIGMAVNQMKKKATAYLADAGVHPMARFWTEREHPTMWAAKYWKVFLDTAEDVRGAVKYVEENPVKERKKRQGWKFVVPFQER